LEEILSTEKRIIINGKENKKAKIKEIIDRTSKETGLTCIVIPLYNGGKYSLYGYKRYTDIIVCQ